MERVRNEKKHRITLTTSVVVRCDQRIDDKINKNGKTTTHLSAGDGVDKVLELVVLSELRLANQVVELHHRARHQVRLYIEYSGVVVYRVLHKIHGEV